MSTLPFDPSYNPRKLLGRPILPSAYAHRTEGLKLKPTPPAEYIERRPMPLRDGELEAALNLVAFEVSNGVFAGDPPDTIRRLVECELDRDLATASFATLVDRWPYLGRFPDQASLDGWLDLARRVLLAAGFTE